MIREDDSVKNRLLNYSEVYAGLHLHEYLSFHGHWERSRLFLLAPKKGEALYEDEKRPRNVFMQMGNVATSRFRLAAGQMQIPFGVDQRSLPEIYDRALKKRTFWETPRYGAKLTYDTQISSHYDIGFASENLPGNRSNDEDRNVKDNRALSLRMMFDVAALEGFRFVFSGYGETLGERRLGVGFINVNDNGDVASFEWIRVRFTPDGDDEPFDQFFRLAYASAFRSHARYVFEYEDTRFLYRMATFGVDLKLPDYGLFKVYVTYHDEAMDNKEDFWAIASGMQLNL